MAPSCPVHFFNLETITVRHEGDGVIRILSFGSLFSYIFYLHFTLSNLHLLLSIMNVRSLPQPQSKKDKE